MDYASVAVTHRKGLELNSPPKYCQTAYRGRTWDYMCVLQIWRMQQ